MTIETTPILPALLLFPMIAPGGDPFRAEAPPLSHSIGQDLEAGYTERLDALGAKVRRALPEIDEHARGAFLEAHRAEKAAKVRIAAAEGRLGEIGTAKALVAHAKGKWIGGADKGIAAATKKLAAATTAEEKKAARDELAHWEQNRRDGVEALEQRQAAWEEAERNRPEIERELAAAKEGLERAEAETIKALNGLGLESLLGDDGLDDELAGYQVLLEATPLGLAEFADRGRANRKLVDGLLADDDLLVQVAVADGAKEAAYGRAMEIYRAIQKESHRARTGPLQRLALAIGLEHAVPRPQRNAVALTEAPEFVDPVARYLHFEEAYLAGELDPAFEHLTVWDYRMVVDGEEPDEILAWGREMLRNYRPDHITTDDFRSRYVGAVRTDIRYGSQDNKYDKDELQFFQNILMNGGVCGRRAFFGRFILRAFGIPTTARPQRGHAALAHWTPDGWVVCLGGGWGSGWTKTRYDRDLDFLATTQARATGESFLRVKRAQWIGDVLGEPRCFGFQKGEPAFWNAVALYTQRTLIEHAEVLAAVGEDIAEANETKEKIEIVQASMTEDDRTVSVDGQGVITIPAVACSKPTGSTGKILFMDSALGGKQLHYGRTGGHQGFEYTFDAPEAGTYALRAKVATPSWKQSLRLAVNGSEESLEIDLPFTVGMWETTAPIEVELVRGENVLRFSREGEVKGVTIKEFTLTPRR